jgi:hypothetical protein
MEKGGFLGHLFLHLVSSWEEGGSISQKLNQLRTTKYLIKNNQ